ncbi:MAG: nicotinic acid mononucleotide adenylyltransferase, partial [Bacteroides sp.]
IEGYPKFRASDFEFHLPRPSYTIHTLDRLKEAYPEREFFLIIGSDNWRLFNQWRAPQRIIDENKLLVYPRPGCDINADTLPANVRLVHSPTFEISSTFIRQSLAAQKDVRYFLHPAAFERIRQEDGSAQR